MKKPLHLVLIVSLFLLSACGGTVDATPEIPAPNVKVLDLSQKPQYKITEVGTIKAVQEVELVAKAAGTVGKFSVQLGGAVESGQTLAVIDFDEANNPAKVNYDSAQLQLSSARQTYGETLANNQDSITRASLRVQTLETALGRLQRNLEELKTTNESRGTTLKLQVENAAANANTAEVNYDKVVDQFNQSWDDLMKSTEASLDSIMTSLDSGFQSVENIINPSRLQNFNVSNLNSSFGVRDSRQRLQAINTYNAYRPKLTQSKTDYQRYLPLTEYTVDDAIAEVQQATDELRFMLSDVRTMLNNSVVGNSLSQTTLDTYIASVTATESTVLGKVTAANSLQQAISTFKLDRTSQITAADNNKLVAKNQLTEAQNALLNYQTTGPGSIRDLEAQVEQTGNDLLSAQADLDSARRSAGIQTSAKNLEISTLSNQVRLAEKSLDNNQIVSPIKGVLSELAVDAGDYVSPGTYLGRVIQSEQVKVVFYVSEEVATRLTMGQVFIFSVSNATMHEFTGFVNKVAPSADPINKKIRIEGSVKNEDFLLKPEMFVNLSMDISTETFDSNKVYVPMNAIIFAQNSRYVYVLENEQAIRRDIEIGEIYGGWVEILQGLQKEDTVIVEGQRNLPPAGGVSVNVVQ